MPPFFLSNRTTALSTTMIKAAMIAISTSVNPPSSTGGEAVGVAVREGVACGVGEVVGKGVIDGVGVGAGVISTPGIAGASALGVPKPGVKTTSPNVALSLDS